jgi:chromosome segregation ATPase
MAAKYPVSALLDQARRYGARSPYALPEGYRSSLSAFPPDWVLDPATNMVMPASKFAELARERRDYQAELRAQQLATARTTVRDLESEQERLTSELRSCVASLDTPSRSMLTTSRRCSSLARRVIDRATSRASVTSALAGQRVTIQELTGKAPNATEPVAEVSG